MLTTRRALSQDETFSARERGQTGKLFSGGLLITLLGLCLAVLLAACGTNGGSTTTGAGSTPTKAVVQQCGTVHTTPLGSVADTATAKTAENCFALAYKQCQPATLGFTLVSLDSGVNRTFSITSANGQCVITDAAQHYIVPKKLSPAQNYTCTSLAQQADGLHFSACGQDGDLLVPATSTPVQP